MYKYSGLLVLVPVHCVNRFRLDKIVEGIGRILHIGPGTRFSGMDGFARSTNKILPSHPLDFLVLSTLQCYLYSYDKHLVKLPSRNRSGPGPSTPTILLEKL